MRFGSASTAWLGAVRQGLLWSDAEYAFWYVGVGCGLVRRLRLLRHGKARSGMVRCRFYGADKSQTGGKR